MNEHSWGLVAYTGQGSNRWAFRTTDDQLLCMKLDGFIEANEHTRANLTVGAEAKTTPYGYGCMLLYQVNPWREKQESADLVDQLFRELSR